jgi:hypothetical protein
MNSVKRRFQLLCESHGHHAVPTACSEFYVDFSTGMRKHVDVKPIKSRRRGAIPDPTVIFVELRKTRNKPGWIYKNTDYIAFEQPEGFIIVPTRNLRDLARRMQAYCTHVSVSGIHHSLYSRAGMNDLVLVLHTRDIRTLCGTFVIKCMNNRQI